MSLLARSLDGEVRRPARSAELGHCTYCAAEMRGKVGTIVTPHWAHLADVGCDPWAQPESDWHLAWKAELADHGCAVEVAMQRDEVRHRADVVTPTGRVVELQYDYLSAAAIAAREDFYGPMTVWVYDARPWWLSRRLRLGRHLPEEGRGVWFVQGGKSLAAHQRPLVLDLGRRRCALAKFSVVEHGCGERLVGKMFVRDRSVIVAWLTEPGA